MKKIEAALNCKAKLAFTFLFFSLNSISQIKETFDLATFTIQNGVQKEVSASNVSLINSDKAGKSYGKIIVYKSIDGSGNLTADFDKDWQDLIATPYQLTQKPVAVTRSTKKGWLVKAGKSSFTFNNQKTYVELITYTSQGKIMSIVTLTNHTRHFAEFNKFLNDLSLQVTSNTNISAAPEKQESKQNNKTAYQYTSSNFDDGWESSIEPEWVLVKKNNLNVRLFFAVPYNSDNFSGTGVMERDYYWDNYVTKYFNIQNKQYKDDGEFVAALTPKYVEGWGTDKQTGQKRFIAMTLAIAPNTAYITLASAADENTFRSSFPKANDRYTSDLADMGHYNKFAVGTGDINGKWQNGNTATAQWYYVTPAGYEGYAGMTLPATSATFLFNSNGTYSSIHNGATGGVGSMKTFQQEYKGKYTVNNWSITATNRYQGKTDSFDAHFKAVKGGRILYLNNKAGQEYNLIRVK